MPRLQTACVGSEHPMSETKCKRCGQWSSNYRWCDSCWSHYIRIAKEVAGSMVNPPAASDEGEDA